MLLPHAYRASLQLHSTYHVRNVKVVERLIGKSSLTFSTLCWWKSNVCRWPVGAIVRIKLKIDILYKALTFKIFWSGWHFAKILYILYFRNTLQRFAFAFPDSGMGIARKWKNNFFRSVKDDIVSSAWQDLHQRLPGSIKSLQPSRKNTQALKLDIFIFFGPYFASSRTRSDLININECRSYESGC